MFIDMRIKFRLNIQLRLTEWSLLPECAFFKRYIYVEFLFLRIYYDNGQKET